MAYGNNLRLHSKSPEGRRARLDPVEIQRKKKKKSYLLDSKMTKQQTRIRQTRTRIRETKSTLGARQKTQQTSCGSRAKKDGICKKGVEAWPRQLLCAGQTNAGKDEHRIILS